jgi:hypothetical protein
LLAYVFFHRAAPGVEAPAYETALRRFHSSLAAAPPPGFIGSSTYRVGGGYADWYLVDGSAVLDVLNEAAVNVARSASHDVVAHLSSDGAGKLLTRVGRARAGRTSTSGAARPRAGYEIRFSKPAGMGYPELYERLKPWTDQAELTLWRRMMVLGPPPEFCLLAPSEVELPAEMKPEILRRDPV